MAGISHNSGHVHRRMAARPGAVERNLRAAASRNAPKALAKSRGVMDRDIYQIPEKTSPTGRRLWARTGLLRRSERAYARGVGIELRNPARHARPRREMNPIPPQRKVNWQGVAMEEFQPELLADRRAAILAALRDP